MQEAHPNPEIAQALASIAEKSQKLMVDFLQKNMTEDAYSVLDPNAITQSFQEMATKVMANPSQLMRQQMGWWLDYVELWQRTSERLWLNKATEPMAQPARDDKRFKDELWAQNYIFDFIKQSYLLSARHIQSAVGDIEGLDDHTARQVAFYTRQFVDALSPTNFAATNPQVLKATLESGGENLLKGLSHLLEDLERGQGRLSLKMTDLNAFQLGENVAATPGKVVFQNDLMQLIQYHPSTEKVFKRPLLITPPWINKFYILDLKPKNSFIKWAVDQGHTVFVISWVNPDASLAHKNFADYMLEGILAAVGAIEQATGEKEINAIGYCIGGTLLSATLAYMATKRDKRIKSATFFTSLIDFSEPGELSVFIDEAQLTRMETHMQRKGYLDGHQMSDVFNLLRENDLIWSFVVNNYLLGREPMPFDLLYWNSDSTRMPAAMHSFYLRNMYQHNLLKEVGGITLNEVAIDIRQVKLPVYFVSAREDHIAPWKATYMGTHLFNGPVKFVLGGSGHIAGVINPPVANKYGYWTNESLPMNADEWLNGATQHEGSWWSDWALWVQTHTGKLVAAREPGAGGLPALEEAPGRYVKARIV